MLLQEHRSTKMTKIYWSKGKKNILLYIQISLFLYTIINTRTHRVDMTNIGTVFRVLKCIFHFSLLHFSTWREVGKWIYGIQDPILQKCIWFRSYY